MQNETSLQHLLCQNVRADICLERVPNSRRFGDGREENRTLNGKNAPDLSLQLGERVGVSAFAERQPTAHLELNDRVLPIVADFFVRLQIVL
jgi:hypothetical protein